MRCREKRRAAQARAVSPLIVELLVTYYSTTFYVCQVLQGNLHAGMGRLAAGPCEPPYLLRGGCHAGYCATVGGCAAGDGA